MKTITIDEFITMSVKELDKLVDSNSQLNESDQKSNSVKIDMKGQSIRDMVEKYNLLSIDQVKKNIKDKLNR